MHVVVNIPEETEIEEAAPARRRRGVLLPPAQAVKVLRARYPHGLVCTRCATLLATSRESYKLTEDERLTFICAECKSDDKQKAVAFERMRRRPKALTDVQLKQADAYCTWCRRWFWSAGQGGMSCEPCRESLGNGWALPGEIPAASGKGPIPWEQPDSDPRRLRGSGFTPLAQEPLGARKSTPGTPDSHMASLRAGSPRQIRRPETVLSRSGLSGRHLKIVRPRKVSEASLTALKRINAERRKGAA